MGISILVHEVNALEKLFCEVLDVWWRESFVFVFLDDVVEWVSELLEDEAEMFMMV